MQNRSIIYVYCYGFTCPQYNFVEWAAPRDRPPEQNHRLKDGEVDDLDLLAEESGWDSEMYNTIHEQVALKLNATRGFQPVESHKGPGKKKR
jgi:hypothetical protein